MQNDLRILFAEDAIVDYELAKRILEPEFQFASCRVDTASAFIEKLINFAPDLVIADYTMPDFNGLEALKLTKEHDPLLPVIILTGSQNEEIAVECMRAGAVDYVIKDHMKRLPFAVKEASEKRKKAIENIGFNQQIIEEKEKLRQSLEMLTKLTDLVPGVVYQYRLYPDGSSAFPFASKGMWNIYEVMPEQIIEDASLVFTRLHPDDYERISTKIFESAANQTLFQQEFRVVLPEQGLCWRFCIAQPELLPDGSTLWYGIISDITERKMADDILMEKQRQLQSITNAANDAIVMINNEGMATFWNPAAEKIFGYSSDEIIGKKIHEIITPESYREKHFLAFSHFISTGEGSAIGKTVEVEGISKTGKLFPIELSLSSIRQKDTWMAVGIMRDISERKRTEAILKNKIDELERFNNLTVGRELKMIELKKEINQLLLNAGEKEKYLIFE
ncbi:MAG: hypothetical protein CVT92_08825 [Bacteroidetes bacterium HGW-Bacteroidetes-1]|jgi:PAS domain S-box-containing protein|nr:MAG: hypothetical protein CVT92_08825 [Bacteroidetes bacterium HGW-Bacteroidetes-1]